MKRFLVVVIGLFAFCTPNSPEAPLTGIVKNELNKPVAGAMLWLKNSPSTITTSQSDGSYSFVGDGKSSSDVLVIVHPYYDTTEIPLSKASGVQSASVKYRRLKAHEFMRILSPNGKESFRYGQDTITVAWLQDLSVSSAGVVGFSKNGRFYLDVPFSEEYWNQYPRDLNSTSYKSYTMIDSVAKLALGTFKIAAKDTVTPLGSTVKFIGDSMMVKVYEPYPGGSHNINELTAYSDNYFSVSGHP